MKQRRKNGISGIIVTVAVFVCMAALLIAFISRADSASYERETDLVENAIRRAAVTCYAVEGSYPATLTYLIDNYGVSVDFSRYVVRYDTLGSNMMPDIEVIGRGS